MYLWWLSMRVTHTPRWRLPFSDPANKRHCAAKWRKLWNEWIDWMGTGADEEVDCALMNENEGAFRSNIHTKEQQWIEGLWLVVGGGEMWNWYWYYAMLSRKWIESNGNRSETKRNEKPKRWESILRALNMTLKWTFFFQTEASSAKWMWMWIWMWIWMWMWMCECLRRFLRHFVSGFSGSRIRIRIRSANGQGNGSNRFGSKRIGQDFRCHRDHRCFRQIISWWSHCNR